MRRFRAGGAAAPPNRPWPPRAAFNLGMLAFPVEADSLSADLRAAYATVVRRWERRGFPSTPQFSSGFENARSTTRHGRDRLAAERMAAEQMHELLHELTHAGILSETDFRTLYERARPKGPGTEECAFGERNAREAASSDRFLAVNPKVRHFAAALVPARHAAKAHGREVRVGKSGFFENYRRAGNLDDRQIVIGPIPPKLHQRVIIAKDGPFQARGQFGPTANVDRSDFMRGRPAPPGPWAAQGVMGRRLPRTSG